MVNARRMGYKYQTEEERKAAAKRCRDEFHERKKVANVINTETKLRYTGMNVKIGTFDKYLPNTFYVEIIVSFSYCEDEEIINTLAESIDYWFSQWVRSQDDYDKRNYIKIVNAFTSESTTRKHWASARKRIRIDLSLIKKQPLLTVRSTKNWKDCIELVKTHLDKFYEYVGGLIVENGLELKTFKGYNSKDYYED